MLQSGLIQKWSTFGIIFIDYPLCIIDAYVRQQKSLWSLFELKHYNETEINVTNSVDASHALLDDSVILMKDS